MRTRTERSPLRRFGWNVFRGFALVFSVLVFLVSAAVLVGALYVMIHFILKYW